MRPASGLRRPRNRDTLDRKTLSRLSLSSVEGRFHFQSRYNVSSALTIIPRGPDRCCLARSSWLHRGGRAVGGTDQLRQGSGWAGAEGVRGWVRIWGSCAVGCSKNAESLTPVFAEQRPNPQRIVITSYSTSGSPKRQLPTRRERSKMLSKASEDDNFNDSYPPYGKSRLSGFLRGWTFSSRKIHNILLFSLHPAGPAFTFPNGSRRWGDIVVGR